MVFEHYIKNKKAVILGLDNVLYPEKDYLLQVYYLFAEFIEYSEQLNAKEILAFMSTEFNECGAESIFEKTAKEFNLPIKYLSNFILLHETARLPLKLLLFKNILVFLQELVIEGVNIFLLVDGNPAIQLNKIKQLEWNGLKNNLKVYFTQEFEEKPSTMSLNYIIKAHQLKKEEILFVGLNKEDEQFALNAQVDYLSSANLL